MLDVFLILISRGDAKGVFALFDKATELEIVECLHELGVTSFGSSKKTLIEDNMRVVLDACRNKRLPENNETLQDQGTSLICASNLIFDIAQQSGQSQHAHEILQVALHTALNQLDRDQMAKVAHSVLIKADNLVSDTRDSLACEWSYEDGARESLLSISQGI